MYHADRSRASHDHPPSHRPQQARSRVRRDQLLRAAAALLAEGGVKAGDPPLRRRASRRARGVDHVLLQLDRRARRRALRLATEARVDQLDAFVDRATEVAAAAGRAGTDVPAEVITRPAAELARPARGVPGGSAEPGHAPDRGGRRSRRSNGSRSSPSTASAGRTTAASRSRSPRSSTGSRSTGSPGRCRPTASWRSCSSRCERCSSRTSPTTTRSPHGRNGCYGGMVEASRPAETATATNRRRPRRLSRGSRW